MAVRNGAGTLQGCIDSVVGQAYPEKELIIIDGASTDRTLDVLRANEDKISYWESRPDRGIYHAWNKALELVRGRWVCFLGADDRFAHPGVLTRLVDAAVSGGADLVAGRVALVDRSGKVLRVIGEPWNWERIKRHQVVAHPGMLHRKTLFAQYGKFNDSYKVAADYEFLLRLGPSAKMAFLGEIIVHIGSSGASRTQVRRVLGESWKIQANHPEIGPAAAALNYLIAMSKGIVRRLLNLA